MEASWEYVKRLAQRSEQIGYDLTLIAELYLNDIKGIDAPALEAWSTAAALAAVTERLELMVAVRPTFHSPAIFAKQAANVDRIANGRLALNVVSSWWSDEARRYGVQFDAHDDRYARTAEWLDVLDGTWSEPRFSYAGQYYKVDETVLEPKPIGAANGAGPARPNRAARPTIYAGGESEAAKTLIARQCDAYVMHGDPPDRIAPKVADMRERRDRASAERSAAGPGELRPMEYGMAAYAIVRDSEAEAQRELERITNVSPGSPGFGNYQDWVRNTQLEGSLSLQDYSVSNRGLRAGLVGTPEQVAERVRAFQDAGVGLLLLQSSPQLEEMERFSEQVMPLVS
jgi:FMNH2-dependent dimethyl sulfone monooxygenase